MKIKMKKSSVVVGLVAVSTVMMIGSSLVYAGQIPTEDPQSASGVAPTFSGLDLKGNLVNSTPGPSNSNTPVTLNDDLLVTGTGISGFNGDLAVLKQLVVAGDRLASNVFGGLRVLAGGAILMGDVRIGFDPNTNTQTPSNLDIWGNIVRSETVPNTGADLPVTVNDSLAVNGYIKNNSTAVVVTTTFPPVNSFVDLPVLIDDDLDIRGSLKNNGSTQQNPMPLQVLDDFSVGSPAAAYIFKLFGAMQVTGVTNLANNLNVTGVTNLSNNLNVTGVTNLSNDLNVNGVATLGNGLNVTGIANLANNLNVSGNILGSGRITAPNIGTYLLVTNRATVDAPTTSPYTSQYHPQAVTCPADYRVISCSAIANDRSLYYLKWSIFPNSSDNDGNGELGNSCNLLLLNTDTRASASVLAQALCYNSNI